MAVRSKQGTARKARHSTPILERQAAMAVNGLTVAELKQLLGLVG